MRRKFIYDPDAIHSDGSRGAMVEVDLGRDQGPRTHFVRADTPGYLSHSGLWVEGARARRNDLKRMGCRPWEGVEAEKKEAARQAAHEERQSDRKLDEAARRAYYQLSPEKRRAFERG